MRATPSSALSDQVEGLLALEQASEEQRARGPGPVRGVDDQVCAADRAHLTCLFDAQPARLRADEPDQAAVLVLGHQRRGSGSAQGWLSRVSSSARASFSEPPRWACMSEPPPPAGRRVRAGESWPSSAINHLRERARSMAPRMADVTVTLPDGSELELPAGATGNDAAAAIGPRLAKDALGIKVDGELRDLSAPLPASASIAIVTARSEGDEADDALWLIRHDAAHVLATAVLDLWPNAKVSIGPPIENGFYYDFEFPDGDGPGEDDLERIEAAMRAHIEADEPFERSELKPDEAIERFRSEGQPYKVELIEDLVRDQGVESVSLYRNGPFTDLCRGPHTPSTGRVGAFKLNSLAGAYWRGDEKRQMLTRIYGTAFRNRKELEHHLELLELARENDHRRLGPELGLFRFREESPGMPFWLPRARCCCG